MNGFTSFHATSFKYTFVHLTFLCLSDYVSNAERSPDASWVLKRTARHHERFNLSVTYFP